MATIQSSIRVADRLGRPSRHLTLQAAVAAVVAWLRNRQERRMLVTMNDDLLRDIGLTRGDVEREYERPFWRAVDHAGLDDSRRRSGPRLGSGAGR